ncbi:MAG TPA: XrtA system polysaccharide chain length determinant, partial [Usitatibacter sp.]|nr:XrtA system polysaccharide chain length determinant [Usitatibacter sp.]
GGKTQDTEAAKRFIDEQIAVYEGKLQEAENRLKDFRLRYLGLSPGDGRDYFARMAEASKQLDQARLELREAERSRDAYRRGLASEDAPQATASPAPDGALAEVDARLEAMRKNLDGLLQRFTEEHPDVVGAKRVIRELEQQRRAIVAARPRTTLEAPPPVGPRAAEQLKVSLAQAEANVAALTMRVAEYTERHNRLKASAALVPQLEAEHAQLNRDYDVNKKNYESLVARRESASISGEMQSVAGVSDFRMVDPPRVSPLPVSPNRRILLPLALILALGAGLAAMYGAHEWRPAFHDARSLREAFDVRVVGTVAVLENDESRRRFRNSLWRTGAAASALVATYAIALVALELLTVQHI